MSERSNPESERDPALDDVARLLDQAAATEASERREAESLANAPGLAEVERTLAGAWGQGRGPRRGPFALFAVLSLAAAAVLLFFILQPERPSTSRGPSGELLNQGTDKLRWTRGSTPGSHVIDWTGAPSGTYRVRVRDASNGDDVMPFRTIPGTQLEVSGEASASWPEQVLIEVEILRTDGSRETLSAPVAPRR